LAGTRLQAVAYQIRAPLRTQLDFSARFALRWFVAIAFSAHGCGERSLFSNALAKIYGGAARYVVEPFVAYAVNGDMTNWLDSQGMPAIFVTIKDYERPDVDSNLKAVQKLLEAYAQR